MVRSGLGRASLFVAALTAAVACSRDERAPERKALPPRDVFIALERDFQDYRSWGSVSLAEPAVAGATHTPGRQRAYINALPPAGSREFPVGTIIVKQSEGTVDKPGQWFAMVKRGGGFNAQGAKGWEWFELEPRKDGSVAIVWRGVGAPAVETYGGDPLGTCNSCHQMAASNDYVKSRELTLK